MALSYLQNKGYEILERNFRSGKNEIDIIARCHEFLIFIEVKYRSTIKYGFPEEMISGDQEDRIRDAAESFITLRQWKGAIRFDVIAITPREKEPVFHIRDAF